MAPAGYAITITKFIIEDYIPMPKFSAQDISETDPDFLIREIYAHMEWRTGFEIAQRILRTYGGAEHPDKVPAERKRACADRLARLLLPNLPPLPPVKDAPVQARNKLEAEVARLTFAEAKCSRKEKAKALVGELRDWNFRWRMGDAVRGLKMNKRERTENLSAKIVAHLEKHEEGVRELAEKFENAWRDFQDGLMGFHYVDFESYCVTGYVRMTFGTVDNPCKRGLAELDFIMHGEAKK